MTNRSPSTVQTRTFQTNWTVFWVAFLLRLFQLGLTHVPRGLVEQYLDHRSFGWEMGRIAHALVTGHGYADPFFGHTGPTAWVAPLYPLLLAAVFKLFGDYSLLSAWIALAINCFLFALITRTLYEIAARCFSRRTAILAAWIWAFYPTTVLFVVWETILSTYLLTLILVLTLRMRGVGDLTDTPGERPARIKDPRTLTRWLLFGFLWALLGLSNPSLLVFLPAAGLWILSWTPNFPHPRRGRQIRFASISALLFMLCLAPWMTRNAIAFHRFIPMRTNFGAELYLGNGPGAHGFSMMQEHPFESPEQFSLYRRMGELAYSKWRGEMARAYIERDPWHFARNTLRRIAYFWLGGPVSLHGHWKERAHQAEHAARYPLASILGLLGLALALKRRIPGSRLLLWAFLLVPLIYYFVAVDERFRFPLDPLIAVLMVYWFESVGTALSSRRKHSASRRIDRLQSQ